MLQIEVCNKKSGSILHSKMFYKILSIVGTLPYFSRYVYFQLEKFYKSQKLLDQKKLGNEELARQN